MMCYGLSLGLALIFCDEPGAPAPADSYCLIAEPIYWSGKDTRKTKEQVDRENAKWTRLCNSKKSKG